MGQAGQAQSFEALLNTSRKGDWLLIPLKLENLAMPWTGFSKFQGWHVLAKGFNPVKILDSLKITNQEFSKVKAWKGLTDYDKIVLEARLGAMQALQVYKLLDNALAYKLFFKNLKTKRLEKFLVSIDFDLRFEYDFTSFGRFYNFEPFTKNVYVLKYCTSYDSGLKAFIVLNAKPLKTGWVEKSYWYDGLRRSKNNFWVFNTELEVKNYLAMGFGFSLEQALKSFEHAKHVARVLKPGLKKLSLKQNLYKSLQSLIIKPEGFRDCVIAGLPWFFQAWTRDELISLKALIILKKQGFVKKVLSWYLERFNQGRVLNLASQSNGLKACDSGYWVWVRIKDLQETGKGFSKHVLEKIAFKALQALQDIEQYHSVNGLINCEKHGSWMDSCFASDCRQGLCIEVQALHLASYAFLKTIAQTLKNKDLEALSFEKVNALKSIVKKYFYKQGLVFDCLNPETLKPVMQCQRPNVFLAFYVFPELFAKHEWVKIFDNALKELWLPWGGLASISKNCELFKPFHTGEDDASYHRGDSWYWVNNIAAISMYRLDSKRYEKFVNAIKLASLKDFENYCKGFSSELSSACKQEGRGCLAQAWSIATLIELLNETGEF
ncbi:hypothetical protein J7L02_00055 [Candidatus Woesearchaeota archaeon]|nr:hypothetical protein [Candidatus Woesearchaeota archaeon]